MDLFRTDGVPARWNCGTLWQEEPGWGWTHIIADVAIWGAYTAIPLVLLYYIRKRRETPFLRIFWLFGAFIFACGTTHLIDAGIFWWPIYRFAGVMKVITAAVSWATVVALIPVVPQALGLRGTRQLELVVRERTLELSQLNERLRAETQLHLAASQALRSNEEKLTLALDIGRMGVWEWDLPTGNVLLDQRARAIWGFGDQARISAEDLLARIHPEDRESYTTRIDAARTHLERYQCEFRIVHPTLGIRWLEGCGEIQHDDGRTAILIIGLNWDITARRNSEVDLRLSSRALEAATNGVVISAVETTDCEIVYVNRGFEFLTGYTRDEVLGKNCRILQGAGTEPQTRRKLHDAIAARESCEVVILNYRRDGRPFWNEFRLNPLKNESGEVTHFVGIQNDVTERMQYESSLRAAQAQAESANRAKSAFLANMSHEIRTPLTVVLGCADTLYPRLQQDDQREMVQMIRDQGRLLLGILNDVLDLSKIEAGKLEIHPQPCSVLGVIEDVRSMFVAMAKDKRIGFAVEYPPRLPRTILSDPLKLRQILINLVGNAIKFTEQGSVTIVVHPLSDDSAGVLRIEVRDTGVGISKSKLQDIFAPFHQEHRHLSQKYGGTGLGLTICRHLVELLGGEIRVQSDTDQGTSVTVGLPVAAEEAAGQSSSQRLLDDQTAQDQTHDSLRIQVPIRVLVVDDTRSIQFLIRRMLEDMKATATIASNGREALDTLRAFAPDQVPFDLVLMDMQMPEVDGYETTRILRAEGYTLPIVALTAAALEGDRERCVAAGCTDYLAKPIDRQQLFIVMATCYDRMADRDHRPGSSLTDSV